MTGSRTVPAQAMMPVKTHLSYNCTLPNTCKQHQRELQSRAVTYAAAAVHTVLTLQ